MKANRICRRSDDAVSPIIGVILMVAITVAMATVVFLLLTRGSTQAEGLPQVKFLAKPGNAGGTLTVQGVANNPDPPLNWAQLSFAGTSSCVPDPSSTGTVTAGHTVVCTGNGTYNLVYSPTADPGDSKIIAQGSFP